ncbi:transport between ER and Golgi ATPase protein, partial [Tulasnella sp. 417]
MWGRSSGGGQPPADRSGYNRAPSEYGQDGGYGQQGGYRQQGGYSQQPAYGGGNDYEKRGHGDSRGQQAPSSGFAVVPCPNETLARTNCIIVSPRDFPQDRQAALVKRAFTVTLKSVIAAAIIHCLATYLIHDPLFRHDDTNTIRPGTIGVSASLRSWIRLSASGDSATVEPLNPTSADYLQSLDIE